MVVSHEGFRLIRVAHEAAFACPLGCVTVGTRNRYYSDEAALSKELFVLSGSSCVVGVRPKGVASFKLQSFNCGLAEVVERPRVEGAGGVV